MESSFGIVPYREGELFLVQIRSGGHWGFPKGHAEAGEGPQAAAERELFEETHLRLVRYFDVEPLIEEYLKEGYPKRVTYFIAEVDGEVALQPGEVLDGRWLSMEEASDLLTYKESKRVCERAAKIIHEELR